MKNIFKFYNTNILISFLVILTISIFFLLKLTDKYIELPFLGIVTLLLFVIDKWLWRVPLVSLLFEVKDFGGTYEGYIDYKYIDEKCQEQEGRLKQRKVIHQTGSEIKITTYTFKNDDQISSPSESKEVFIEKKEDNLFELTYFYQNSGNTQLGFHSHHGTEMMKLILHDDGNINVTGEYYTNRMPQTRGKFVEMKRINKQKQHAS